MSDRKELMRRGLAVASTGDPDAMIAMCDPDVELHFIGVAGEPVFYRGHDGIREYFRDMAQSWERFELEPKEIEDHGGRMLVIGAIRAKGRGSGAEVDARQALIVDVEGEKAVRIQTFYDPAEARREIAG